MNIVDRYGDIEAALRGELSARADALEAAEPPYAEVQRAVRRDRSRRLAGAASGLALVAALIVVLTQTLGNTSGSTVNAAAGGPSALLTIPTRGNLAGDSAFIAAVKWRLDTEPAPAAQQSHAAHQPPVPASTETATSGSWTDYQSSTSGSAETTTSGYSILYANDDGTHRVVIASEYDGHYTYFVPLVGAHGAAASALKQSGETTGTQSPDEPFTFIGSFTADGAPVPFAVLGPTNMTNVEYSTSATLTSAGDKLSLVRQKITQVPTTNGTATGEIPGATTATDVRWLDEYTVFRAEIAGRHVDADPDGRTVPALPDNLPTSPAYNAIKAAVAQQGRAAGLTMPTDSPGGDAVPDNVAQTLLDLALFDSVTVSSLTYHVDWIGRETAQWDAALLDIHAPGLPAMQIFVRGLTADAPDAASPGLARTLVRPAIAVTPGQQPQTGAAFGGIPEPGLFGFQVMTNW